MHIKLSPFRSSPPEVFSKEDAPRNEENPQENTNTEARSQQSRFATLLKSHPCTDASPKIRSTSAEYPPWENTSGGLLLHVKIIFKDLNYEKFLFTVVKRNLLAIKMDKQTNKIIIIIIIIIIIKITSYPADLEMLLDSSTGPCYFYSD